MSDNPYQPSSAEQQDAKSSARGGCLIAAIAGLVFLALLLVFLLVPAGVTTTVPAAKPIPVVQPANQPAVPSEEK